MTVTPLHPRITVHGPRHWASEVVLTREALAFLVQLARFAPRVREALELRATRQGPLGLRPETRDIREGAWSVEPCPEALRDRRVEVTGPAEPAALIAGLGSGASAYVADLEDATAPTFDAVLRSQLHLRDAVAGTLHHIVPETGKSLALPEQTGLLMVRPRALHALEQHLRIDGVALPAALVDFGLFAFHNAAALVAQGRPVCLALAKLESHGEAQLWNDIFVFTEGALGLPSGAIQATVVVETLPAIFAMDEMLHALRTRAAGLALGHAVRLAFSLVQSRPGPAAPMLPDARALADEQPWLRAVAQRLIETCHRRGTVALAPGSSAIPSKRDAAAHARTLETLRIQIRREIAAGFDGFGLAHAGLVPAARALVDGALAEAQREGAVQCEQPIPDALLQPQLSGPRTEQGLRESLRSGLQVLEAWLSGEGTLALGGHRADISLAELCRAQLWQWLSQGAVLDDGRALDAGLFRKVMAEELLGLERQAGARRFARSRLALAANLLDRLVTSAAFEGALTLPAYELLLAATEQAA